MVVWWRYGVGWVWLGCGVVGGWVFGGASRCGRLFCVHFYCRLLMKRNVDVSEIADENSSKHLKRDEDTRNTETKTPEKYKPQHH